MSDIILKPFNDVYMYVDCSRSIMSEMSNFFTFNVPGAKWTPKFKAKLWDGKIRLLNINNGRLYCGLASYVKKFAKINAYTVSNELGKSSGVDTNTLDKFIDLLDIHSGQNKITLRDY